MPCPECERLSEFIRSRCGEEVVAHVWDLIHHHEADTMEWALAQGRKEGAEMERVRLNRLLDNGRRSTTS